MRKVFKNLLLDAHSVDDIEEFIDTIDDIIVNPVKLTISESSGCFLCSGVPSSASVAKQLTRIMKVDIPTPISAKRVLEETEALGVIDVVSKGQSMIAGATDFIVIIVDIVKKKKIIGQKA